MELKKFALIAETVGGIAILITLVILVAEIRSNTRLIERQIILDQANADARMIDSPYLAPIYVKVKAITGEIPPAQAAFMKEYDLTLEEAARIVSYIVRDWTVLEADFDFGTPGVDRRVKELLQFEGIMLVWMMEFSEQETEFAKFVNDQIE